MTQGPFESTMTSHYKDLRGIYAKRMECHGVGMALMHPISGDDCQPVSCGYFDRNGDWNLITRLTADTPTQLDDYFFPLEYQPRPAAPVEIEWQPKTSSGVTVHSVDASGETPDALPAGAGADVQIKYKSNTSFGAVLMTQKPVTLRAYNDEALFCSWLSRNQGKLYDRYGPELKKYGLWIITRTYTTKQASISAWMDKRKDQEVSLKAKAAMLGELGEDLDWKDRASDKDWSHYKAKTPSGVVVFIDGIEVKPFDWWFEGVRSQMASSNSNRGRRLLKYMPDPVHHQATFDTHNWGKTIRQIDHEEAERQRASVAESQHQVPAGQSPPVAPLQRRSSGRSPVRHSIALSPRQRGDSMSPGRHSNRTSPGPRRRGQSVGTAPRPLSEVEAFQRRPSEVAGRQQEQRRQRHSDAEVLYAPAHDPHAVHGRDWHPRVQQHHHLQPPHLQHGSNADMTEQKHSPSASPDQSPKTPAHHTPDEHKSRSDSPMIVHSSPPSDTEHKRNSEAGLNRHRHRTPEHEERRDSDSGYEFYSPAMMQQHSSSVPPSYRRPMSEAFTLIAEEDTLKDAGLSSLSRSASLRKTSIASIRSRRSQTPSLRRESRNISEELA